MKQYLIIDNDNQQRKVFIIGNDKNEALSNGASYLKTTNVRHYEQKESSYDTWENETDKNGYTFIQVDYLPENKSCINSWLRNISCSGLYENPKHYVIKGNKKQIRIWTYYK